MSEDEKAIGVDQDGGEARGVSALPSPFDFVQSAVLFLLVV